MDEKSSEEIQQDLIRLRDWIKKQQLPQDLEDKQLLRFLHCTYYDVEKAKSVIELFFSIRGASPDLFTNRDPLSAEIQTIISITKLGLLHISENKNLWLWQLNDPGLKKFDYVQGVNLFLLMTDSWLLEDDVLEEEDIIVMDVKDVGLKMLTLLNMSAASRCNKYQQDALPLRLKQVHVLNVSPIFHKIFSILKPFINKEVKEKIKFHLPQSETIYDFINKEDLPEEFGGTNGNLEEHTKDIVDSIMRNRDYLMKENLWSPSNKKSKRSESSDINRSIQTLVID